MYLTEIAPLHGTLWVNENQSGKLLERTYHHCFTYQYVKVCIEWVKNKKNECKMSQWMNASNESKKKKKAKLICCLTYQNSFFLNWLFSSPERVWQRNFFTKLKEEWNKEIHQSKFFSLFKTQVIFFLNSKHTVESGGMWIMLNLVFYVFKGKQLAKVKFSCWFQFIKYF